MLVLRVVLVALLFAALPASAQYSVPNEWDEGATSETPDALTPTELNANFGAVVDGLNNIDPNADGEVDLATQATSLTGPNTKWAKDFLSGSTTCGIQEAFDEWPGANKGTIVAPAVSECFIVTTQIVLSGFGLRIIGHGMANANSILAPTRLVWGGAEDTFMFRINGCRGCEFSDFSLYGDDIPGSSAVWYYNDNSVPANTNKNAWRNISIRNFDGWAIREFGADQTTYNDQHDSSIFQNIEIREVKYCYETNSKQAVGLTVVGGECLHRDDGVGFNIVRGWWHMFSLTSGSNGDWGRCSTTTENFCKVATEEADCPSVETCTLVDPGPAFKKGAEAANLSVFGLYSEWKDDGFVCDGTSANVRPISIYGSRLNIKADPDTGDPDVNFASIDCEQAGPIVISGTSFESAETNVRQDVKLYDTPVRVESVSVIGASNATDESRVRWVDGDPRNEETCQPIYAPGGILDTDDIATLWRAPWGTTITSIWCKTDTGTITANLQNNDGTPADIATSDIVCNAAGAETSTLESTEQVINRGDFLGLDIASLTGSPTELTMCWRHRR